MRINTCLNRKLAGVVAILGWWALDAQASTFTDSLMSTSINSTYWTTFQTTTGLYTVDPTTSGLVFSYNSGVTNPGGTQNVGLQLNLSALGGNITGDFSFSVAFSGAALTGGGVDQVELHSGFSDSSIFFDSDSAGSSGVHVWTGSQQATIDPTITSGTFTISRTGNTLSGYLNGSTLLFSETDTATLSAIGFVLQNNLSSHDNTAVTFSNFSITAASIPSSSTPEPSTAWFLLSGAVGLASARRFTVRRSRQY